MKIRTILIAALCCFVIIPMVIFAVSANISMRKIAINNYTSVTQMIAEKQSVNIAEYFKTLSDSAKMAADNPYIDEYVNNGDEESIQALINSYDNIIENSENSATPIEISKIMIADNSGELLYTTGTTPTIDSTLNGTLKNISTMEGLEDGEIYCYTGDQFSDFPEEDKEHFDPIFGKDALSQVRLMTRYKIGDKNMIVFFSDVRLKSFFTMSSFENNSRIVLIDPMGSIIDGTYIGNIDDAHNSAYKQNLYARAGAETAVQVDNFRRAGATETPTIGFVIQMPVRGVSGEPWTLAMISETERAYNASNEAIGAISGVILLLVAVFCAVGIILIVILTKPLKVIRETLLKVSRGDHEARINFSAKNEYGDMARAFNDLIDDIVVSEGRYRTIVEMSDNIIFEWNLKSNEVFFSNNFNKKFSYRAPSDHFADSFLLKVKVHPEDSDRYHEDLERLAKGEEFKNNEYRWKNIYGDYIWVLMRTATIRTRDGDIAKIVGVIVDVDRAKRSEMLLTERASFDSLTSLYNRESIERTIDSELHLLSVRKNKFAILFIDVDDFKNFNDQYSHATGDQVLKFVARTISDVTHGFGTAGRYGGDEFIVCVRNIDINEPTRVAQDILNTLRDGFTSDSGEHLVVNTSIGISIVEDSSMTVDEIIGMADDAMYRIKKSGKSNFGILNKETIKKQTPPSDV